jgi:hypothetical protein
MHEWIKLMKENGKVIDAMVECHAGDAKRINHFLKVYGFAPAICAMESSWEDLTEVIEIAAITHDIGIKNSEKKYISAAGSHLQIEGPPEAKILLERLCIKPAVIDRVCQLIAQHHTYDDIQEIDYHQILIEADFLVNAFEDALTVQAINSPMENFRW